MIENVLTAEECTETIDELWKYDFPVHPPVLNDYKQFVGVNCQGLIHV